MEDQKFTDAERQRWFCHLSKKLAGFQQSISAYDLDGDGKIEILYNAWGPGRLYVLDHTGKVLRQWIPVTTSWVIQR